MNPRPARERGAFMPRGRGRGFTLIELIMVLVLVGILAASVVPQFSASQATVLAQAGQLASDLRHLQMLALNRYDSASCSLYALTTTAGGYSAACGGTTLTDPITAQGFAVTLAQNVTLCPATTVYFDTAGRPTNSSGALLSAATNFTLITGGNCATPTGKFVTVVLSPITGFVNGSGVSL